MNLERETYNYPKRNPRSERKRVLGDAGEPGSPGMTC